VLRRQRGKPAAHPRREFCAQRVGISRPYAEKVIRLLEELGPGYFARRR
jgi:hypothetical protein